MTQAQANATVEAQAETVAPKLTMEACEDFGRSMVAAFTTFERAVSKAGASRMETIREAIADLKAFGLNRLTAAEYARGPGKSLGACIDKAVTQGKLAGQTGAKVRSNVKAITLAVLNGLLTLKDDDGLAFAYESSVKALAAPDAQFVYEGVAKAGAKAGKASAKAGTGKRANAKATPAKPNGSSEPSGTDKPAAQARLENLQNAALALAFGNRERAERFVVIATKYGKDFDVWASDVIAKATQA